LLPSSELIVTPFLLLVVGIVSLIDDQVIRGRLLHVYTVAI